MLDAEQPLLVRRVINERLRKTAIEVETTRASGCQ
jgi:hypothetical protein